MMIDGGELSAEMDMTPVIDLVFNLIIFFMVVSDMTALNFAALILPKAPAAQPQEPTTGDEIETMIVNVDEHGEIFVGGAHVDRTEIVDWVKVYVETQTGAPVDPNAVTPQEGIEVIIRADRGVRFEYVHHVFDACQRSGIYRIRVAAIKEVENAAGG